MKAVRIHSFGDSSVLTLEEATRPQPAENEVLIRVHAASVNPVDYKIRSGEFRQDHLDLPLTLGRDIAGVVESVGKRVNQPKVGEEVYAFLGSHNGGYAEYAVATAEEVAAKPKTLDYVHAAAVPLAAITAWQALFDHGQLQTGQRVLIHGAAGGVGHFAVQFAKVRGATVVATASADDFELVRQLGADGIIDYKKERFENRARDIDLVIDLVGGEAQKKSWSVLKEGGILVSTLAKPSSEEAANHRAQGIVFMAEPRADQLAEIGRLIDEGKIKVFVNKTLPLSQAKRAHDELEKNHSRGKLVLTVT